MEEPQRHRLWAAFAPAQLGVEPSCVEEVPDGLVTLLCRQDQGFGSRSLLALGDILQQVTVLHAALVALEAVRSATAEEVLTRRWRFCGLLRLGKLDVVLLGNRFEGRLFLLRGRAEQARFLDRGLRPIA